MLEGGKEGRRKEGGREEGRKGGREGWQDILEVPDNTVILTASVL